MTSELTLDEEVKVYEKNSRGKGKDRKFGYRLICNGRIDAMTSEYILVNNGNYKSRFDMIDFRIRKYRVFKTCGYEVKFPPLPDKAAIEEELQRKAHENYINSHAGKGDKKVMENHKKRRTCYMGKDM